MDVQLQFSDLTQFWLSQLNEALLQTNPTLHNNQSSNDIDDSSDCTFATQNDNDETANIITSNGIDNSDANACEQNIDYTQLAKLLNQNNENLLAALLKKSANATTPSAQKHQQNALIPPTPPRTPITTSAQQQQVREK